jgi:CheY-like chemotaxis protein
MRKTSPNKVLVVDDDPSLRALLSRQLERAGFEIDEAEDGIDGVVKLRIELPKVIISDLQMPRMAGIEFLSVVRRRFPFIPVVVLSGLIPNEVPAEAEPDAWFEKGALNISELLQTLRDLVRQTPERIDLPQVVTTPVRTESGFAGYFMLSCPDCLRTFRRTSTPQNKTVEQTAVCTHCEARVPFQIESSAPE